MKSKNITIKMPAFTLFVVLFWAIPALGQTTAFTYQGRLTDGSAPANGTYSMQFRLYDTDGVQSPGNLIAAQSALVSVTGGIFTVKLDFGAAAFNTAGARYLEIQVGSNTLTPRQEITSAPFAMRATTAAQADALSDACDSCVTNDQINSIDAGKITGTISNAANSVNFSGNLGGDVTGTQTATVVSKVGGQTSSSIASTVTAVNNATNLNNANAIVRRDGSGNFIAGTIFATTFNGNATSATTATTATTANNFSGALVGDVGGTQGATVIQPNAVTASKIASNQVVKSLNGLKDAVTLAGGNGISMTTNGNAITFSYTGTPFKKFGVGGLNGGFQYTIPHNLGTTDVIITAYRLDNQGRWEQIALGLGGAYDGYGLAVDANTALVGLFQAGTYRVIIIGG